MWLEILVAHLHCKVGNGLVASAEYVLLNVSGVGLDLGDGDLGFEDAVRSQCVA